jgi:hypothetical protein
MCRNIKPLRESVEIGPPEEIEAAARQFVRKVSGFSKPSPANQDAFDRAVVEIAAATDHLLRSLTIAGKPTVAR